MHRLEKYLNLEGFLEKSLKIKYALESTGKLHKGFEKSLNSFFSVGINTDNRDLNQIKLLCLYLMQQMLHQIKAQQFHTNFLVLISPLSQSNISEVEFNTLIRMLHKLLVLETVG